MEVVLLLSRVVLATVFGVAGVAKILDRDGARRTARDLGVPMTLVPMVSVLIPAAELLFAVALIPVPTAWWGGAGLLTLLIAFSVAIAIALARGRTPDCRCFGQLKPTPIGPATLARNIALASLAALIVVRGTGDPGPSLVGGVYAFVGGQMLTLLLLAMILIGLAVLLQVLRQYGRLLLRVESLEARVGANPSMPVGLPVGSLAPQLSLTDLDGQRTTLQTLSASGNPILFVFVEPSCGACDELLGDVAAWQQNFDDRLTIALVSRGVSETGKKVRGRGVKRVLVENDQNVAEGFLVTAIPSAVLVKDGLIAAPLAAGLDAIRALASHATLPPPLKRGDQVPPLPLRAIDGAPLDLGDLRGRALLLFWNPGCGFCQQMLDGLKQWERVRTASGLRLVVITTGAIGDVRRQAFASPVVLDEASAISRMFGANGTPSAVVVHEGRVVSDLEVGAPGVWKLAGVKQAIPA